MELILPEILHDRIRRHLEASFPNEGGGFLVGTIESNRRIVTEVHPVENVYATEAQFHRFMAESGEFQRIEDEADARGLSLLGYYHSHPNHPAIPSEFDRVHAWPFFAYLIIAVREGKADESRIWELSDDRSEFIEGKLGE